MQRTDFAILMGQGGNFVLSENIKTLRTEKGLTQEELAVRLNVVRQTVSKWERDYLYPIPR